MAAVALIKHTQGPNTDIAGNAVIGTLFDVDGAVTVTNDNNTDVASWTIILLDAPALSVNYPPSANPQVLATAASNTPMATFDPDVPGTYRVLEDVVDGVGARSRDIRCFGVPDSRGVVEPPYQKYPIPLPITPSGVIPPLATPPTKPDEQNYGGQVRGWAGERTGDGQESTFRQNYKDMLATQVSATPFTQVDSEVEVYLVNPFTIGSSSVFNVATGARIGQQVEILDNENDAYARPIVVTLAGGDQFKDATTTRVIYADGGSIRLLKAAANLWHVLRETSREDYIPIVAGDKSTQQLGYQRAGGVSFRPTRYPLGARYELEVVGEVDNAADPMRVRLYNVTTLSAVATFATWTSLVPERKTTVLASPADIAISYNIYEIQHELTVTGAPNTGTISSAHIRVVYAEA